MPNLLLVMFGGAIGAGFRYHIGRVAAEQLGQGFPWGTFIVNLLGALMMGIITGIALNDGPVSDPLVLFLGAGMLGGFTTFSAFSLEAVQMIQRGDIALAGAYAMSSVAGSILLLFAGLALARSAA